MKKFNLIWASIIFILLGCDLGPGIKWEKFTSENFQDAKSSGQPTLIYFYATWCGSCRQLNGTTLKDSNVIKSLEDWNLLRVDMSSRHDEQVNEVARKFDVWGLPTLIFYDSKGRQVYRKAGYISAADLQKKIKSSSSSGIGGEVKRRAPGLPRLKSLEKGPAKIQGSTKEASAQLK